ncbi:MAG TPA: RNA-splicing ligase RtcB, partial [Anaerolineae bacterium]|nr:RNA-splicing ligase RtcB [Anaerolineae bacterium]
KIAGFVFGDGHIHFEGKTGKGVTWFYGEPDDLEAIRQDVQAVGFTPSRIYTRERTHQVTTTYKEYEFTHSEAGFKVAGSSFAVLLAALGVPVGNKAIQDFHLPAWIQHAPRWQQRLFLASFFGAELSAPRTYDEHGCNFYAPVLSLNKHEGFIESGEQFLNDLSQLLAGFGVETLTISRRAEQVNADSTRSYRLRLILSSQPEHLINLWGRIGFEFNRKHQALALVAVAYLKHKQRIVAVRNEAAVQAVAMRAAGVSPQANYSELASEHVNRRFLERSLYGGRQTGARIGNQFETFEAFRERVTAGIEGSGMVWERIAAIEPVSNVKVVYDFTVAHPDHNFVANGFVVSNCGVRLLASNLSAEAVEPHMSDLATALYKYVPSGVGVSGQLRLSEKELDEVLATGSDWALKKGYGRPEDLEHTEERGHMAGADPSKVSRQAKKRGRPQLGTLGAGNHFAEIDEVVEIYDPEAAEAMGLFKGQIVVQIHCGSRGLGHQVASDYVKAFQRVVQKYGIRLPDRELVSAPLDSPEGQDYLAAMMCAANYAWANRQLLTHWTREAFAEVLGSVFPRWDLWQVYDIAHNMAKIETHEIDGRRVRVCVHRKGATRAFGPGSDVLSDDYKAIGQPVLVPGSMGTASWVLVGTPTSMAQTFGSTCHGAGRMLSRAAAKKRVRGSDLRDKLEAQGIEIRAGSMKGLAEEAPIAYKDVDNVVQVVQGAGIARKVAKLLPLAVVKG